MVTNALKWTSIHSSEIEKSKFRFEASVFNIEAKKAKNDLAKCKYPLVKLCGKGGLAQAHHFGRFKRIFVEKSDMPIFQPSQILDIKPKPDKYISAKTQTDINALRVKENQLLLTCSGSIGKCTIVTKTLANLIFSHDLIRIKANIEEDTGFIYTYLQTKTGQLVLATNNYGAVIQHIEPEHLENVTIPNASENIKRAIHEKVMRSFALRDESNNLIDKAEKLLLEALNLPEFDKLKPNFYAKNEDIQTFVVNLDLMNDRFEGSYHIPIISKIIDYLLDSGAQILPLGSNELTSRIIMAGRFKRNYVEDTEGVVFLGGKQIYELDPTGKKYLSIKQHDKRIASELFIKENMIVITCSGTIGKVNIVPKHWEKWTMSQHVLRAVPKDKTIAGYLYIWLNSDFGRELIVRQTYGSVVDEIHDNHLSQVPIPILKDEQKIKEINDLALKANELRSEAYYLEQAAIKQMNEEVIFVTK